MFVGPHIQYQIHYFLFIFNNQIHLNLKWLLLLSREDKPRNLIQNQLTFPLQISSNLLSKQSYLLLQLETLHNCLVSGGFFI